MATLTYSSFVSEIAAITVISSNTLVNGDTNFPANMISAAIDYAEGRLYRELDLPIVSVVDTSVSCSSGVRSINISTTQGEPLAIERLNLLTSAGATSSYATRIPLTPTSPAVIDAVYPSATSSNCGRPTYFARLSDVQIILGPTPDQAYGTEVQFTTRPTALSDSNSSTWLTQNVPELMIAGAMIFMSGYMRDYGSQSDNPQMAQSWEQQFKTLLESAKVDSDRMKWQSNGWTSAQPSAIATPPRV